MSGLTNKLTGQIGEYLVCAKLGKLGLIATPFAGNVPTFDILVADRYCRTLPIQVKTTTAATWPSRADLWMNIKFDHEAKQQLFLGARELPDPELIHVLVALRDDGDRFFVLSKRNIQTACIASYSAWMDPKDWKRPRKYRSLDCRYPIESVEKFEDKWDLISEALQKLPPIVGGNL